jgi:hypothetical protein
MEDAKRQQLVIGIWLCVEDAKRQQLVISNW